MVVRRKKTLSNDLAYFASFLTGYLLVNDKVDGHLALQAADVTVAEIIAELVNLKIN